MEASSAETTLQFQVKCGAIRGLSYNTRFANPIIMQGRLFYQKPWGNAGGAGGLFGTGGDYVAVDLQTGAELWRINPAATGTMLIPSFGYLYSYEDPNQHGVLPNAVLIAPYTAGETPGPFGTVGGYTCWAAYEPRTGKLTSHELYKYPLWYCSKRTFRRISSLQPR